MTRKQQQRIDNLEQRIDTLTDLVGLLVQELRDELSNASYALKKAKVVVAMEELVEDLQ